MAKPHSHPTHYLHYWKPRTVQRNLGEPLDLASGDQFKSVGPGDVVWIVTVDNGRLELIGRLKIDRKERSQSAAARRLGKRPRDIWRPAAG